MSRWQNMRLVALMQIKTEKKVLYFETLLPLINIVFLLLIFFLLAGSFKSPEPFLVNSPYANAATDEESNMELKVIPIKKKVMINPGSSPEVRAGIEDINYNY